MRAVQTCELGAKGRLPRAADAREDAGEPVLLRAHAHGVAARYGRGEHAHEQFVLVRDGPLDVVDAQHLRRPVAVVVTGLRVGDEVFGVRRGAAAEYVAVPEGDVVAAKPPALSHEEAAAVPDGSLLALTCLRPAYPLEGKRVLVYGAAGSVGTAAVQLLAHHFEARVTGVCDTKDVDLVRSLGARDVVDRLSEPSGSAVIARRTSSS